MSESRTPPETFLEADIHGQTQILPVGAGHLCRAGRAAHNTIVLDSSQVSRDHALVDCPNGIDCVLSDLGSVNGTYLNGVRLAAPEMLRNGDVIGIGEFRMIFHQPAGADAQGQDALLGTVVQIKNEEITVMVVDIRGFTQLSQEIGAEKLGEVMGHFIRESGSLLRAQGAWGQKYIGDAVMGIWMHDAARPGADFVLKALHCIHGISRIAGSLQGRFLLDQPVRIGAGINTGFASIGNLGSTAGADHTALGDAVNKAFRLESATKDAGCDVLAGQSTLSHLERKMATSLFVTKKVPLKGYASPETCFGLSFATLAAFLGVDEEHGQPHAPDMNCPKCNAPVPDDARQCPACSTELEGHPEAAVRGMAKAARANDATVAVFSPSSTPGAGVDERTIVTPPGSNSPGFTSAATPPPRQGDAGWVDFGPRYRVERLLGQGGMGAVYLAYDQDLGRRVALKLVRPEFTINTETMARFRQELLLASKISHRNILRIHDLGDAGGMKFISMAYVDGEDLHQLLSREGKLPLDRMLHIARQLCAALDAAHSEGVAHRDLKPQNIMLGKDDHVFVTDFGLAKSLDAVDGMTQSGAMMGTPRYMAPEQVEAKSVDARTDIYALGLIFYEMLTGDVPFKAETTLQLMYKRAHEIPPAPKTVVADIPDWLNDVVMKCLERDPANRYQSAGEILADIDAQQKPATPPVSGPSVAASHAPARRPPAGRRAALHLGRPGCSRSRGSGDWGQAVFHAQRAHPDREGHHPGRRFRQQHRRCSLRRHVEAGPVGGPGAIAFPEHRFGQKVRAALQQMSRQPNERLSEDTAREVCQRAGSKAFISGAIARLGNEYVVGLNAINCGTGDSLAREQSQAAGKERVLDALGKAAAKLRGELGESLPSVQKFDVPLEQATTSSLEALKAFSLGRKQNNTEAVHYYERAIELDPKFAAAYLRLGIAYSNLGQTERGNEYITKAFELREHASEREKLHIASMHYWFGTGELEKAIQTFTLWAQSYPRDWLPYHNLGGCLLRHRAVRKSSGGNSRIPAALSGQCDRVRESRRCSTSR